MARAVLDTHASHVQQVEHLGARSPGDACISDASGASLLGMEDEQAEQDQYNDEN